MRKGLIVIVLSMCVLIRFGSAENDIGQEEKKRLDLIKEAYWRMDKHYYKPIDVSNVGNLFYRCQFMMMSLLRNIDQDHVVNLDRLTYSTISLVVDALKDPSDKYSKFIYKDYLQRVIRENLTSKFSGIGFEVETIDAVFFISKVYDGSSASERGVLKGDQLLAINGQSLEGLTLNDIEKKLRLDEGAKVRVTLLHAKESARYEVTLVSRTIWVPSVTARFDKGTKIGYLTVNRFRDRTADEFKMQLDKLEKKSLKGIIVDLRGNSGGDETQAIKLCSYFVPKDSLIVYFMKRGVGRREERTKNDPIGFTKPMALIVDNKTASAAEIFSGAMKIYQRATVIGVTTNGLGSLKNTIGLSDGSALFLITSRSYLPTGETYDQIGIKPDIEIEGHEAQMKKAEEIVRAKSKEGH